MIQQSYDDGKQHFHALSYGGGTQSTALLLMALEGKINGVIPDWIIFADTGWEPKAVYDWINKVSNYIKEKYNREIYIITDNNIRQDIIEGAETGRRFASLPFYTRNSVGQVGMALRQCTGEYKILPINKKIREFLGYKPRFRVKEIVHIWKGISTDEIQRVKPARDKWQVAEHPLVDLLDMDRDDCIRYVEESGLGTPPKSSCIGCPFHNQTMWKEMKKTDPESWNDAVYIDNLIRELPRFKGNAFLHRSGTPLESVKFNEQMDLNDFLNECEGFCGN